ncbi:MAG: hypothetical protein JWQ96_2909 [Segetibacter sp.]|nr:hypothetical protein [Segetibacter sp.]
MLTSCYSVRVMNKDATPEPDPFNTSPDFYKGKMTHVLDTIIGLKLVEGDFHLIVKPCSNLGIYSFEYRVTFGGVMLSAFTFGKKRKVNITYVCVKENN